MKRIWLKVICCMVALMMLGAGAASAGQFVFGQHAKQMAEYDAQMAVLKAKTAEATKAREAAEAWQDKCMAPLKMVVWPLPAIGYGIQALRYRLPGVGDPTNSPLEYAVVPSVCRGVNTAKNYGIQNIFGGVLDLVTIPFGDKTNYAPRMNEMGILAKRTMERGPIANILETAASATPAACVGAGVLAPISGVSFGGTVAIFGTTVPVAATAVGEAAGAAEKAVLK